MTVQKFVPEALLAQLRVLDISRTEKDLQYTEVAEQFLQNPSAKFSDRDWITKTKSAQGADLFEGAKLLRKSDYLKITISGVRAATSADHANPSVKPRARRK